MPVCPRCLLAASSLVECRLEQIDLKSHSTVQQPEEVAKSMTMSKACRVFSAYGDVASINLLLACTEAANAPVCMAKPYHGQPRSDCLQHGVVEVCLAGKQSRHGQHVKLLDCITPETYAGASVLGSTRVEALRSFFDTSSAEALVADAAKGLAAREIESEDGFG